MKITELRIGNIVNRLDKRTVVTAIQKGESIDYVNTPASGAVTDNQIEPVTLTREILEDFEFKKDVGKNNLPIMRRGGLYVYLDDFTITYMGNILAGEGYVHQLQNIYFALYGVDLVGKSVGTK